MRQSVKPTLADFESLSILDRAHLCEVIWKREEAERTTREVETGVGLPPLTRYPVPTLPSRNSPANPD